MSVGPFITSRYTIVSHSGCVLHVSLTTFVMRSLKQVQDPDNFYRMVSRRIWLFQRIRTRYQTRELDIPSLWPALTFKPRDLAQTRSASTSLIGNNVQAQQPDATEPQMGSQLPASSLGTLNFFPLEIRQIIYSFMLAADPAITRVSKAVYLETQPLVRQYGICRINVKYDRAVTWGLPSAYFTDGHWHTAFSHHSFHPQIHPNDLARVQNLKINVGMVEPYENNLDIPWGPSFSEIVQSFVSLMVTRKNCHLVFTLAEIYEICPAHEPQIASSFEFIQGFELMTLELRKRPWFYEESNFCDRKGIPLDNGYGVAALKEQLLDWGLVKKNGSRSRLKIIMGVAGGSDGEVLWDSNDSDHGEPYIEDPMEE